MKNSIYIQMFFIIVAVFLISFLIFAKNNKYVRGKYGQKCYNVENINPNIKYPLYYKTLEDCLNSFK